MPALCAFVGCRSGDGGDFIAPQTGSDLQGAGAAGVGSSVQVVLVGAQLADLGGFALQAPRQDFFALGAGRGGDVPVVALLTGRAHCG